MEKFPFITIIFILIWIIFSFKVASVVLGIVAVISLYVIGKDMYKWNPRRSGFKTEGDILREKQNTLKNNVK